MASNSFINLPQRLRVDAEQWNFLMWQRLCETRVAIPGIVKSFDATKQTVTVQPALRENINQGLVSTPTELPLLPDIPILMPRAGTYVITLPVSVGDECLVVFMDMCMDAWWQSGGVQNQVDRRRHDLADGVAILGIWSQPNRVQNYSTTALQIRNSDGSRLVEITNSQVHVLSDNVAIEAGNVQIQGDSQVTIQGSGPVDIQTSGDININGGDVAITGSTVKIEGKEFLTHKHTGVSTGGGISGPVS